MLICEYNNFKIRDDETIERMFGRFSTIVNDIHVLGKTIPNCELIMKILKMLPKSWQSKVNAIQKKGNSIDKLKGKLLAYERTYMKEEVEHKKKNVTFKSTTIKSGDEEENLVLDPKNQEKEIALMVKSLLVIYKRK